MWQILLQIVLHMVPNKWEGRLRDHCEVTKSRCLFNTYLEGTLWPQYVMLSFPHHCHIQVFLFCNFQSHDKQISYQSSLERKEKSPPPLSTKEKYLCFSFLLGWSRALTDCLWASNTPKYKARAWKQSAQVGITRELSVNSIHHPLWKMADWTNTLSQERKGQGSH